MAKKNIFSASTLKNPPIKEGFLSMPAVNNITSTGTTAPQA